MRIIVLGLPHTQTSRRFSHCAYTQKAYNLCKMMHERGHEVIHVGVEVEDGPPCAKNVACVHYDAWAALYGKKRPEDYFDINKDDAVHKAYMDKFAAGMRSVVVNEMGPRHSAIICVPWGGAQRDAVHDLPQFVVESGIGYRHTWANYRVYESYAWLHFHMGLEKLATGDKWYWVVIPNAFDVSLFKYCEKKDDYFLYLGRLNADKGVQLAIDMAHAAGVKIKLAGQGNPEPYCHQPGVEYVGPVNVDERRELLAYARALCCPTRYIGPFEGVHIEAGLSGTPVITTDWGVFSETVLHGVTGFRCRTIDHFEWAARHIEQIRPSDCRAWAKANYSLERVATMYEEFFQQVLCVAHTGWPAKNPKRVHLDWLRRRYPEGARLELSSVPNPHPLPTQKPSTWEDAQQWERLWWGTEHNSKWDEEVKKQNTYARLMGMPSNLHFGTKRILDVGCGPVSILRRSQHGPSVGVDPMPMSEEVQRQFGAADVRFVQMKAEDVSLKALGYPSGPKFDEAWCYNCLQHVEDVSAILENLAACALEIRIFEWLNLPPCPGHPQTLTHDMFTKAFPRDAWEYKIHNTGTLVDFGGTVTNAYIALHLVRRT